MSDEELISRLHEICCHIAANRIEELVKERDDWKESAHEGFKAYMAIQTRGQDAEARATQLEAERDAAWKRAEHAEKMWGEALTKKQESLNAR